MSSEVCVALIRGINVGSARRVSMADLRAIFTGLGYVEVRTLLSSGNVIFSAGPASPADPAPPLASALGDELGVPVRVTVLPADEFVAVVAANPLGKQATDPSRLLVAIPTQSSDLSALEPLGRQDWSPEAIEVGKRAAYLWCPGGVSNSQLWRAVERTLGDSVTSRNWTTVLKLESMLNERSPG
jgi:uncharacterized protein (DUF1697 family)